MEYFVYHPNDLAELEVYEGLWNIAVQDDSPALGGPKAVEFFKKSGLDTGILKAIWTWCSPDPVMNKDQFFTALRYISIGQSGENFSRVALQLCADKLLPPPRFNGMEFTAISKAHVKATPSIPRREQFVQPSPPVNYPRNSNGVSLPPPAATGASQANSRIGGSSGPPLPGSMVGSSGPPLPTAFSSPSNGLSRGSSVAIYPRGSPASMPPPPPYPATPNIVLPPPPSINSSFAAPSSPAVPVLPPPYGSASPALGGNMRLKSPASSLSSFPVSNASPALMPRMLETPISRIDLAAVELNREEDLVHEYCYVPHSRRESTYFDMLWSEINPGNEELIGGQAAVDFFLSSGLSVEQLKEIWLLSSPDDQMDVYQFYTAVRFIAMYQSGERILTREKLLATVDCEYRLPIFAASETSSQLRKLNEVPSQASSNPTLQLDLSRLKVVSSQSSNGPSRSPKSHSSGGSNQSSGRQSTPRQGEADSNSRGPSPAFSQSTSKPALSTAGVSHAPLGPTFVSAPGPIPVGSQLAYAHNLNHGSSMIPSIPTGPALPPAPAINTTPSRPSQNAVMPTTGFGTPPTASRLGPPAPQYSPATPPISSHRTRGSHPPPSLAAPLILAPRTPVSLNSHPPNSSSHSNTNPRLSVQSNPNSGSSVNNRSSVSPVAPQLASSVSVMHGHRAGHPSHAPPPDESEMLECVICLCEFDASNGMASTRCACGLNMALFHRSCLKEYLTQRDTCPNCGGHLEVLEDLDAKTSSSTAASIAEEEAPLECVICLMEFDATNRMASTQCACGLNMALFHKDCLRQWLTLKSTCPNCDQPLIVLEKL